MQDLNGRVVEKKKMRAVAEKKDVGGFRK